MLLREKVKVQLHQTMEDILKKHRKEKKDLQNKITGMKKQASKSQRKEVNAKCELLQADLQSKHDKEISEWQNNNLNQQNTDLEEVKESGIKTENKQENDEDNAEITPEMLLAQLELENKELKNTEQNQKQLQQQQQQQQLKKRRNRQKERLAKREQEIARMKEEAAKEAAIQPDLQKLEQESLDLLCNTLNLKQVDIRPDGHCLFASILDQLKYRHKHISDVYDVYKLRHLACEYISNNRDDFIPYLFDETTMQLQDVDEYIKEMESTAKWGGEIEIIALANIFDCPISILISGQATHKVNETGTNPELKLVYYKHSYSLGEHYNSLHDLE